MNLSLISPSRNNLKYLQWSYNSVRKHWPKEIEYCVADDFSDDGTAEWCEKIAKEDPNFKWIRNEGPTRLGHTILYDTLINEVSTKDYVMIWHADMHATPGSIEAAMELVGPKKIVSLTRIEPPLHPPGVEKVVQDFGVEPEAFDEEGLLNFTKQIKQKNKGKITKGVFAPWVITKTDFQEIGGHDEGFYPQSKEDSDIWNRLLLNGCDFEQTWDGYVYHMTCRGSRRAKGKAKDVFTDSPEWLEHNQRSTRNFIRKWGTMVRHDELEYPVIPKRYKIRYNITDCTPELLHFIEPYAYEVDTNMSENLIDKYIKEEQENTKIELDCKFHLRSSSPADIVVTVNGRKFTNEDAGVIDNLADIITDSGEEKATFELGNLTIEINSMKSYEDELIKCDNIGWRRKNMK